MLTEKTNTSLDNSAWGFSLYNMFVEFVSFTSLILNCSISNKKGMFFKIPFPKQFYKFETYKTSKYWCSCFMENPFIKNPHI